MDRLTADAELLSQMFKLQADLGYLSCSASFGQSLALLGQVCFSSTRTRRKPFEGERTVITVGEGSTYCNGLKCSVKSMGNFPRAKFCTV